MKRSRFSEEQIIEILKEHEAGVSIADLCRKHGVSDASIYKWKAKFGGMEVSQAAEDAGGREHAPEAVAGRRHAGQCGVEGTFWERNGDARDRAESCRASRGCLRDERTADV